MVPVARLFNINICYFGLWLLIGTDDLRKIGSGAGAAGALLRGSKPSFINNT